MIRSLLSELYFSFELAITQGAHVTLALQLYAERPSQVAKFT